MGIFYSANHDGRPDFTGRTHLGRHRRRFVCHAIINGSPAADAAG